MRTATINRNTSETKIQLSLNLDDPSKTQIDTGIGFFDHMLAAFAKHGRFGLIVKADGDLAVDPHHTTEDVGIALGLALKQALGNKAGIERFGSALIPLDETLSRVVIDLSGRAYLVFKAEFSNDHLGGYDTEVTEDFFQAFAFNADLNLHAEVLYGRNTHHKIETLFKALGRALRAAVTINPEIKGIPSTKGVI
ncbi:MAG: imidazoleglycerol-phosphate dehydratase HisB [Lentilactobacillus diolivorans]|jgi:imidazoleglycerol-phosphate dehydratase|nr:imidazoleglycerol-phosphate dehydratase HisB [Lentilactobacillus diolivorans]MCH4165894.1 imidazoleglycerol-phosphate dehydratase HisB [Lentilactobacillus diolivorans]MDH5105425.1 imidazoleglycerol-phosphate dehydratase HisB [Lentilactobacillus diolivorans]RRG01181.1 MAG: imidazoleglycerol-phosphate dehydratase HisB [Lactobacillus sp.]GEP24376.1 imidazoleglycerol-phosphate dehydratase [Lentilactobacillus diolivorans]